MKDKSNSPASFVTKIEVTLAPRMIKDLQEQGFEISKPEYTVFSAKKTGVSCTLYTSGKLLVQGKDMAEFMEFYLEPQILLSTEFTYQDQNLDLTARIGIDESGKGDFFGPLCVAGVYASGEQILKLKQIGVKDSKALNDISIIKIAKEIRKIVSYHIVRISPAKYNEIYGKFKNLNSLLGWGHATAIEALVTETGCQKVIIDQFAGEWIVETALKRKNLKVELTQRHKAEEDLVVAAASILARYAFLESLDKMKEKYGMVYPKGASAAVIAAGKKHLREHGEAGLADVGKLHFKTLDSILGKTQNQEP